MKPKLYLLTHSYPFARSETFLESEVPVLAEKFDIVFVPAKIEGEQRAIPTNSSIDNSLSKRFKLPLRKIRSLFNPRTWTALLSELPNHRLNIGAIRRVNSFMSDALATYNWYLSSSMDKSSIIYTYWMTGKTQGLIWARQHQPSLRIVTRAHRFDLYDDQYQPSFWPLRQQTIDGVDGLFVISDHGKKFLENKYRTHPRVVVSRLGAIDPEIRSSRSTDGTLRIVSCSSFLPQKRVQMMATFIVGFASKNPQKQISWHHFGDGPLREAVLNYLAKCSPKNLTTQFPGSVSNQTVLAHYKDQPIDVFLNLSDSEGIPVSIMEAQACGITVIATDVGGVAEIVNNNNGFLVDENIRVEDFEDILKQISDVKNVPSAHAIVNFYQDKYHAVKNYTCFSQQLLDLSQTAIIE
jgi:glycosyltransferase involved in cell wall biosynthesis